ncbi:MAG: CoA transferase [Acidimicrobiaceae bacterium]|nr:CoA transferase [Acidimicrobiaceae bacterium]
MTLDIRVVERASSVAAAYCGRLLGMLGADVIKLEPPGGDPMRATHPRVRAADGSELSAQFEYLNCYKRSVALDGPVPGSEVAGLLESADVILDHVDGDPDKALAEYRSFSRTNPRLVHVVISSFGLTGPYRHYRGNDFIDFASGGFTFVTGETHRTPVQGGGPWAGHLVGTTAAIATLAGVRRAAQTGHGQLIDVGAMEAIAASHQWSIVLYTHQGVIKRRAGNLHAESFNPLGPVPCKDGWVSLGVASLPQWEGLCLALDLPELLADERFQTGGDRFDHADELAAVMDPVLTSLTADEVVARCEEHHVPAGPVLRVSQALDEVQLAVRGYWASSSRIGGNARMPERSFRVPGADAPFREAPAIGEHTREVLEGLPVPWC